MHEWALAEAVVSTAVKAAKEQGLGEITGIKIKLGQLQQIDKDTFEFALREIVRPQHPVSKKVNIDLQVEKAVLQCRVCGKNWTFGDTIKGLNSSKLEAIHFVPEVAHAYVRCPKCGNPDFKIVKGRGVWIDSISGERVD